MTAPPTNGQHSDPDRQWMLRALRGDITSEGAYNLVRNTRYMWRNGQLLSEAGQELVAALNIGDNAHLDDAKRFEPLEETWLQDTEPDPATTAAFEELAQREDFASGYQPVDDGWDYHDGIEQPKSALDKIRAALLTTEAIRNLPPPDHLIAGYLNRNSLATLYGPSGGGKTFLALDWALHTATGSHWQHADTKPGPVLYMIAEGATGIGRRLDAWQTHHKIHQLDQFAPITWIPHAVNLADRLDVAALRTITQEIAPALIIIDTLARCTVGVEENSARDVGVVIDNLDTLRRATGACVLTIHHTGKDLANGARGSSALRAAMDTEIELLGADNMTVRVTKQKDGPEPKPLWLARKPAADSLVLVPASEAPIAEGLPPSALEALEALRQIQTPGGVSVTDWKASAGLIDRTFLRARSKLLEAGLVDNLGSDKRPLYRFAMDDRSDTGSDIGQ